jgi:hypothetical protein
MLHAAYEPAYAATRDSPDSPLYAHHSSIAARIQPKSHRYASIGPHRDSLPRDKHKSSQMFCKMETLLGNKKIFGIGLTAGKHDV